MIWKPNVTVASIVELDGKFLMVEEESPAGPVLNQPAGHLDPNESMEDAVIRETLEETGWKVELKALVGIYHYPAPNGVTYFRFSFAATAIEQLPAAELDAGIIGPVWLTLEELSARKSQWRSPMVKRCIEDFAAGKRFPLDMVYEYPNEFSTIE